MQPYQAVKPYRCPGCDHEIAVGLGHEVVVPTLEPELRRHWHTGCWFREQKRARAAGTALERALDAPRSPAPCPRSTITDATSKRRSRPREPRAPPSQLRGERRGSAAASSRVTASTGAPNAVARPGLHLAEHDAPGRGRRRGRARPRGSASCGRGPRSPPRSYHAATSASPRWPSARRGFGAAGSRGAGLTGPCRRAPRC